MARILTVAIALFALTVILGSAVSSFFSDSQSDSASEAGQVQQQLQAQERADWSAESGRRLLSARVSNDTSAFVAGPSESVMQALVAETRTEYGALLDTLGLPESRKEELLDRLAEARVEMSSLLESANMPPGVTDWEYLLDSVASLLDDDELSSLEMVLVEQARAETIGHFGPQLELAAPGLDGNSRRLILDRLANEFVLTPVVNGQQVSGQESGAVGHLLRQLRAVSVTRDAVETALPPEHWGQAEQFFNTQLASLQQALILFGYPTEP
jgi:hypothetical protein